MSQYGYPQGYNGADAQNRSAYSTNAGSARGSFNRLASSATVNDPAAYNSQRRPSTAGARSGVLPLQGKTTSNSPVGGGQESLSTMESSARQSLDMLSELRSVLCRVTHENVLSEDALKRLGELRGLLHASHTRINDSESLHVRDSLQHITIPGSNANVETYLTNSAKVTGPFPAGSITVVNKKYISTPLHVQLDQQRPEAGDITLSTDYRTQPMQVHASPTQFPSLYISQNSNPATIPPILPSQSQLSKTHKLCTYASHAFHSRVSALFPALVPTIYRNTERLEARFDPSPALSKVLPTVHAGLTEIEVAATVQKGDGQLSSYLPSLQESYLQRIYPRTDLIIAPNVLTGHEQVLLALFLLSTLVRTMYPSSVCFAGYDDSASGKGLAKIQIPKLSLSLFANQNLNQLKTLLARLDVRGKSPNLFTIHLSNRYNVRFPFTVTPKEAPGTVYQLQELLQLGPPVIYGFSESPLQMRQPSSYHVCRQLTTRLKRLHTRLQLRPSVHILSRNIRPKYISLWAQVLSRISPHTINILFLLHVAFSTHATLPAPMRHEITPKRCFQPFTQFHRIEAQAHHQALPTRLRNVKALLLGKSSLETVTQIPLHIETAVPIIE